MEETGVVKEILALRSPAPCGAKSEKESLALVSVRLSSGQGAGRLASPGMEGNALREIWAQNQANAKPGDRVAVSIPDEKMRATSLVFYILPLASILAGAFLGKWAENQKLLFEKTQTLLGKTPAILLLTSDNSCILLAALFLLISFIVLWQWNRRLKACGKFRAVLVRVLGVNDGQGG